MIKILCKNDLNITLTSNIMNELNIKHFQINYFQTPY